ncbi:G-protein-coupled receptor family protein [Reticulomyxa filosa]|uniref:G-protein-coupled receptor family protein n=1 Tax=Reticulomyxa filosa TaxID=46433 RepID=X6MQG4_RETFI|nr:G-protein-coupled receptor family protein [Reticulomyxa filosa]|eukprot:ETO15687.1 G-protein-coupled receptor family protein [Reticulomyxa filosa]
MDIVTKFSEGRSGAFFFYTLDNKYIIKTVTKSEAQLLLNILPHYKEHMDEHRDSYLNKFFGLHSLKMYRLEIYFVVLANVFVPGHEPQEKYDLKGSWIDRHTNHHVDLGKLMKDEDLKKALLLDPEESHKMFQRLKDDTRFLMKQHIMDYSLLLGIYYVSVDPATITKNPDNDSSDVAQSSNDVHEDNDPVITLKALNSTRPLPESFSLKPDHRPRAPTYTSSKDTVGNHNNAECARAIEGPGIYFVGIIDMLQKWDTNKKVESYVKNYLRCKDRNGLSCVEPGFYRTRFLRKMLAIGIKPDVTRCRDSDDD